MRSSPTGRERPEALESAERPSARCCRWCRFATKAAPPADCAASLARFLSLFRPLLGREPPRPEWSGGGGDAARVLEALRDIRGYIPQRTVAASTAQAVGWHTCQHSTHGFQTATDHQIQVLSRGRQLCRPWSMRNPSRPHRTALRTCARLLCGLLVATRGVGGVWRARRRRLHGRPQRAEQCFLG